MKSNSNMSRRDFFQSAAVISGLAIALPMLANAEERRRGGAAPAETGKLTFVDPNDQQAKGMNYHTHASEIKEKGLMVDRNGVKFADQKCINCNFFDKTKETTIDGKKGGPCQMPFAKGKVVSSDGWCATWAKKV